MHATTIGHVMEQMLRPHFAQVAAQQQGDYGLINAAKYFGQQGFDDPLKVGATADFLEEAGSPFSGVIRQVNAGTPDSRLQQLRATWGPESGELERHGQTTDWHELQPYDNLAGFGPPETSQLYGRTLWPNAEINDFTTYREMPGFLNRMHYTPPTIEEYMQKHWPGVAPDQYDVRTWEAQLDNPYTIIPEAVGVEHW